MYLYVILSLIASFFIIDGRVLQEDAVCRREHGVCTQSMYKSERLFAQRSSGCSNFCQCAHASTQLDGSVTYMWVKHECPAGTLFDENLRPRVCNHYYMVQCKENGGGDDACQTEFGVCNKTTYEKTRLLPLKSSGCADFCHCEHAPTQADGSVTYRWAKQECPPGTLFDDRLPGCNHAYFVKCSENDQVEYTTKAAVLTTDSSNGNGEADGDCQKEHGVCIESKYEKTRLLPLKSSGCAEYCHCEHASTQADGSVTYKWAKRQCAPGTLFDDSLTPSACNHAGMVQCNENDNGDADCQQEHGECSRLTYNGVRFLTLKSSGCADFCHCEHASTQSDGSVTYRWAKQQCAPGTLFDDRLPGCNHAYLVKCSENDQVESTTKVAVLTTDSSNGNSEGDDDCQEEHGVCIESKYEKTRLLPLKSSGCAEYCHCEHASTQLDGSVTYKWAKRQCAPGTLFDDSLTPSVCNHAGMVQCNENDNGDADCHQEHGECSRFTYNGIRFLPLKSSGCADYCHCEHASTQADGSVTYKWAKQQCAPGTLFDDRLSGCNHAYLVNCSEQGKETTPTGNHPQTTTQEQKEETTAKATPTLVTTQEQEEETTPKATLQTATTQESQTEEITETDSVSKESSSDEESQTEDKTVTDSASKESSSDKESQTEEITETDSDSTESSSDEESKTGGKTETDSASKESSSEKESKTDEKTKTDSDSTESSSDKESKTDGKTKMDSDSTESSSDKESKSKDKTEKDSDSTESSSDKESKTKGKSSETDSVSKESSSDEEDKPLYKCYKCHKEDSNSDCNQKTEVCKHNKQSCQTIVEWRGYRYEVRKGCKNPTANSAHAKLGCKKTGSKIYCRYECTGNLCNKLLPAIDLD